MSILELNVQSNVQTGQYYFLGILGLIGHLDCRNPSHPPAFRMTSSEAVRSPKQRTPTDHEAPLHKALPS